MGKRDGFSADELFSSDQGLAYNDLIILPGYVDFGPDDYLIFGRETAGLPRPLLEENRERWLRVPMFNPSARSLNLSNCVALVLFEALRQQGFPGEVR